ncbi:MAG: glycosyltransferase family 9 protein [Terriglobia bacterium]
MNPASLLPSLPPDSRLLVIRLRSLGDIVLLTPSLRMVKQWRPDLRLSVLIEDRFQEILRNNPCVDEVLVLRRKKGVAKTLELLRLARELRSKRFALCLNLHGGPTSAHLTRLSGARWKAGFFNFRSQGIYDLSAPNAQTILSQPVIHTAEHQAAPFFWLGLPLQPVPPSEVFVTPAGVALWQEKLRHFGLPPGRDYAILHPPALFRTKQWPPEQFARLGEYLEQSAGLSVIYSAGPGESACLDEVERAAGTPIRRPIRRLEGLGLEGFIAAIAGARLFVGNDSGPAHLAAALGRPLVVIFGSSNASIWKPWAGSELHPGGAASQRENIFSVVQNPYECNPCPGDRCYRFERPECILSVTFDQVRAAADLVLSHARQMS